jgi:fumarylacetoacetate (FAA) hydrolase family protein
MQPGDVIEITVEGLGTIRNRVVAEEADRGDWRWRPAARTPGGL